MAENVPLSSSMRGRIYPPAKTCSVIGAMSSTEAAGGARRETLLRAGEHRLESRFRISRLSSERNPLGRI